MDNKGKKVLWELEDKASSILSEFMLRVTKFEELVSVGSKFLVGFHEAVEVRDCQRGLQDYLAEAKGLLNELNCFIDDIVIVLRTSNEIASDVSGHFGDGLVLQGTSLEKEAMELRSIQKPEVSDCASIMGTICSMVKQDYTMQEKIICSLSLKSSSAELQSYCLMWSLRPFINDDIMHHAWKLIPQL
ncbi:uncharacterized protein LOC122660596 isoform X3 [Telopea speciosissima]|uniref:uncharacterized protein LOC122660596 isoform X3 n=1 Tax=Telopea speciosissima TaxID=54955 RepID=UPI001CC4F0C9|nr:uncharacterized protein LOC122660596 isoform X3 [Telopea speciosissima]